MIRNAESKDIDRIMLLLHQVNDVHAETRPDLFIKGSTKYEPKVVLDIVSNPKTPVFVYEDESGVVEGYCFCIIQDHSDAINIAPIKTLYIDDLCVNAESRGKHIGSRLYEFVKDYAAANGFYNITLNVWCCNPSAMKFYESIGLKPFKIGMEEIL